MKLLIISSQYSPIESPESAHTLQLAEHMAASGVDVCLLTSQLLPGAEVPNGYTIDDSVKSWRWNGLPSIVSAIQRFQPDRILLVYLDWIYNYHPMVTFLPGTLRWIFPRIKFVTQFENVSGLAGLPPKLGRWSQCVHSCFRVVGGWKNSHTEYGSLLSCSASVIVLSERHLETFLSTGSVSEEKFSVIPAPPLLRMAPDVQSGGARKRGRALQCIQEDRIVLGYFGYIYPSKGIEFLLDAFSQLRGNLQLLMIGSGDDPYLSKLEEFATQLGITERVVWLGHCSPDDVASSYIASLDICVLPFNDGVRLNNSSFAVAASHGIPIVATRGEVVESVFIDGENVKFCSPKDACKLSEVLDEVIDDQNLRASLAAGALKVSSAFSWSSVVQKTLHALA